MSETGSYLCNENIYLSCKYKNFEKIEAALNEETSSIYYGFIKNKFANKTFFFLRQEL